MAHSASTTTATASTRPSSEGGSPDPIEEACGVNLYGFCGNDGVENVDVLGLVADVVDVIATIRTAEASHPKPPCSNCVYVFFYDREKKSWWHTTEDNSWISHVAISTGITNNIVGFSHEEVRRKQIYSETRKDIALIVRICGYSATDFTAINDFIRTRVGCATYDGKSWKTYGPNCAGLEHSAGAETIYRAPDWKGKESNTK